MDLIKRWADEEEYIFLSTKVSGRTEDEDAPINAWRKKIKHVSLTVGTVTIVKGS